MDQIFNRLERLVKAWTNFGNQDGSPKPWGGERTSYSDPDLAAAMAELDDFLDPGKTETERREAEAAQRARASAGQKNFRQEPDTKSVILEAYRYLGLPPYSPFPEVKTAYKKLLLKYHPDRNAGSAEGLKKATDTSAKINAAYQIIEAYEDSRKGR